MQLRKLSTKSRILAVVVTALVLVAAYAAGQAIADPARVTPIKHRAELARAQAACPLDQPRKCRIALMHAYAAIGWQRRARNQAKATSIRQVTIDAINWAAERYGVSAWAMRAVANCESHLWPFATNGQYLGAFQLGATHRQDPIFRHVPWQDAYAQASHVARFVKAHGYGQWQCRPGGGLRW